MSHYRRECPKIITKVGKLSLPHFATAKLAGVQHIFGRECFHRFPTESPHATVGVGCTVDSDVSHGSIPLIALKF
jgi:hypothetical protein